MTKTPEQIVNFFTNTNGLPAVDATDKEIARIKADLLNLEKEYRDKLKKYDSEGYAKLFPNIFGVPSGELQKYKAKLKDQQDEGVSGTAVSNKAMLKAKKEFEKTEKQYLNTKKRLDNKEAERISTIIKKMRWRGQPETLLQTMSLYLMNKDKPDLKDVSFDYINETWNRYFTQELKDNLFLPKLRFRNDYETYETYDISKLRLINGNIKNKDIKRVYGKQFYLILINGQSLLNQARRTFMNLQRKVQDDIIEEYDRFMKTGRAGRYVNARRVQRLAKLRVYGSDLDQADFDIIHKGVDQKGYETYLQWAKEQRVRLPLEGETVSQTEIEELKDIYNDLESERQSLMSSAPALVIRSASISSTDATGDSVNTVVTSVSSASPSDDNSGQPLRRSNRSNFGIPAEKFDPSGTQNSNVLEEKEQENTLEVDSTASASEDDYEEENDNSDQPLRRSNRSNLGIPAERFDPSGTQNSNVLEEKEQENTLEVDSTADLSIETKVSKPKTDNEKCKIDDMDEEGVFLTHLQLVGIKPNAKIGTQDFNDQIKSSFKRLTKDQIDQLFSKKGLLHCKSDLVQLGLIYEIGKTIKEIKKIGIENIKFMLKQKIYGEEEDDEEEYYEEDDVDNEEFNTPEVLTENTTSTENLNLSALSDNEMEGYEAYTDSDLDNLLTGYEIDDLSGSYSDSGSYSGSYDMDESDRD